MKKRNKLNYIIISILLCFIFLWLYTLVSDYRFWWVIESRKNYQSIKKMISWVDFYAFGKYTLNSWEKIIISHDVISSKNYNPTFLISISWNASISYIQWQEWLQRSLDSDELERNIYCYMNWPCYHSRGIFSRFFDRIKSLHFWPEVTYATRPLIFKNSSWWYKNWNISWLLISWNKYYKLHCENIWSWNVFWKNCWDILYLLRTYNSFGTWWSWRNIALSNSSWVLYPYPQYDAHISKSLMYTWYLFVQALSDVIINLKSK